MQLLSWSEFYALGEATNDHSASIYLPTHIAGPDIQPHDQAQPQDRDLLDLAAVQTFLQGGTVYVLEETSMPVDAPVAAIYRYGIPAEV